MRTMEVLSPVGRPYEGGKIPPAPRVGRLDGLTIGLLWNAKSGGDLALDRIGAHITQRFPNTRVKQYIGAVGAVPGAGRTAASDEDIEKIVSECQAVIASTAD